VADGEVEGMMNGMMNGNGGEGRALNNGEMADGRKIIMAERMTNQQT